MDVEGFSARLDEVIYENRFTISVVFPVVGAVTLLLSAAGMLPSWLAFNPFFLLFGILVMRLPLLGGLVPVVSKRVALGVVFLSVYAYIIEYVGMQTGWPYGYFSYGVSLGPMVFGVPVALPLLFLPLVLNAYLLGLLLFPSMKRWRRVVVTALFVVAMDVVLDPAAVELGFWSYVGSHWFHEVPLKNFLGWVFSAGICVFVFDAVFDQTRLRDRLDSTQYLLDDLVSFVLLWGAINAWYMNVFPFVFASLFGYGLVKVDRFDIPTWR